MQVCGHVEVPARKVDVVHPVAAPGKQHLELRPVRELLAVCVEVDERMLGVRACDVHAPVGRNCEATQARTRRRRREGDRPARGDVPSGVEAHHRRRVVVREVDIACCVDL